MAHGASPERFGSQKLLGFARGAYFRSTAEDENPFFPLQRREPHWPRRGPLTLTMSCAGAFTVGNGVSRGDSGRRNGWNVDRQSVAARSIPRPRRTSPSSTRTTATSTNLACSSCRSGSPAPTTSCDREVASSTDGIAYVKSAIDQVDLEANEVTLENGTTLGYDVLVVATGAVLVPEETEGLTGDGWMEQGLHLLLTRGSRSTGSGAGHLRRRPAGRQRRGHAHQVPGRPARVLLPGRLVLPRARHP